jgi:predicted nucleic acid-binding protein
MTHGFDTSFLIATEVRGHEYHDGSRERLQTLRSAGDDFAIAPQVLAEFIHAVTDRKRFSEPLTPELALSRAENWWTSGDVRQVLPNAQSLREFFEWMRLYKLSRNRILDTLLAATYKEAGIASVLTTNARDFTIFNHFQIVEPLTIPVTTPPAARTEGRFRKGGRKLLARMKAVFKKA